MQEVTDLQQTIAVFVTILLATTTVEGLRASAKVAKSTSGLCRRVFNFQRHWQRAQQLQQQVFRLLLFQHWISHRGNRNTLGHYRGYNVPCSVGGGLGNSVVCCNSNDAGANGVLDLMMGVYLIVLKLRQEGRCLTCPVYTGQIRAVKPRSLKKPWQPINTRKFWKT